MKQVLSEHQELVYNWFDFVLLFTRKSHPTYSSNPKQALIRLYVICMLCVVIDSFDCVTATTQQLS